MPISTIFPTVEDLFIQFPEITPQDVAYDGSDYIVRDSFFTRQGINTQEVKKNRKLLKELEMDLLDLLMALFKEQPRIVKAGHFKYEALARRGVHHFERDNDRFRGTYIIYYKGRALGQVTCKPHKQLLLFKQDGYNARLHYANSLLRRLVSDYFPGAKIEVRYD